MFKHRKYRSTKLLRPGNWNGKGVKICKVYDRFSHNYRSLHENEVISVSLAFIGKGFSLSVLEPRLQAEVILFKKLCLEDSRSSLLCSSTPSCKFWHWFPSKTWWLLIGQTIPSFSDSLKVTSADVATEGPFLIGCFNLEWLHFKHNLCWLWYILKTFWLWTQTNTKDMCIISHKGLYYKILLLHNSFPIKVMENIKMWYWVT